MVKKKIFEIQGIFKGKLRNLETVFGSKSKATKIAKKKFPSVKTKIKTKIIDI